MIKSKHASKKKTQLSDDQVAQACLLWMHGIEDKRIATAIGVSALILRKRLNDTPSKTYDLLIMGKIVIFEDTKLSLLKAQFKKLFEPSYLQRLHAITDSAESDDDYKTASSNIKWLMEKIMPDKYGKSSQLSEAQKVIITLPRGLNQDDV